MEVIPSRELNLLYIVLDIIFLTFFLALLIYQKKFTTVVWALAAGLLYFIVDYGIFYLALGTRSVEGANTAMFLFWLSMSYGITNFAWIWLWMKKDRHLFEWSLLIVAWWVTCPLLSQNFGGEATIFISRGTGSYHGVMAAIMFVGYALLCVYNLRQTEKSKKINILWLLIIGILVQFCWEASLLITGIRAPGFGPLIVNSLIETNLGMPYVYMLFVWITKNYTEDLKKINVVHETEQDSVPNVFGAASTPEVSVYDNNPVLADEARPDEERKVII